MSHLIAEIYNTQTMFARFIANVIEWYWYRRHSTTDPPRGLLGTLAGQSQERLLEMQVKEDRKSECPFVMNGIEAFNMALTRKGADFYLVFHRKMI